MREKLGKKQERENQILLGLVELYLKTGKPVGSNTLKNNGLDALSSATIRNYFSNLEESGYLKQHHASGGRIPTDLAYKFYITSPSSKDFLSSKQKKSLEQDLFFDGKELPHYLAKVADMISNQTQCACFVSTPRFDQDFAIDVKLISIDSARILAIVLTNFGLIQTQPIYIDEKMSLITLKKLEAYFKYKLVGIDQPILEEHEQKLAESLYNEVMLRYIVGHANFTKSDFYKSGFSHLLNHEEFHDAVALSNALSLFENPDYLHSLCESAQKEHDQKTWIGQDLGSFLPPPFASSVMIIPYYVNESPVGSIGIVGPTRMPYKRFSHLLKIVSESVSDSLTKSLFKHQITYRVPKTKGIDFKNDHPTHLENTSILLENKSPIDGEESHE